MKIVGIIRSIGERTESFSKFLLEKQVDEVKVIKNISPLKQSVIEYLKVGLDYDYLVINDADVFVKPNCVKSMLKKIGNSSMITAHTTSKFFKNRQGGIRIYNCKKCEQMINYIEKNNNIRPEFSLHQKFQGKLINDITSLHEYEQYYKDIYLRFNKHSIKSKQFSHIITKNKNNKDYDFRVAYSGFFDKEKDFSKSFIDLKEKEEIFDFELLQKKYKL